MSNPNRGSRFPYPSNGRERGQPNPNGYRIKVEILSFSENLDIESFLDWIYEVEKFFHMAYVLTKKQIKFVAYKIKGGATAWCD